MCIQIPLKSTIWLFWLWRLKNSATNSSANTVDSDISVPMGLPKNWRSPSTPDWFPQNKILFTDTVWIPFAFLRQFFDFPKITIYFLRGRIMARIGKLETTEHFCKKRPKFLNQHLQQYLPILMKRKFISASSNLDLAMKNSWKNKLKTGMKQVQT